MQDRFLRTVIGNFFIILGQAVLIFGTALRVFLALSWGFFVLYGCYEHQELGNALAVVLVVVAAYLIGRRRGRFGGPKPNKIH